MKHYLPSSERPFWAPLAQIVAAIGGIVLFLASLFLGLAVLAVIVGLAVLVFAAVSIRMWWLRRQLRRHGPGAPSDSVTTIEGEYVVLDQRRRRR